MYYYRSHSSKERTGESLAMAMNVVAVAVGDGVGAADLGDRQIRQKVQISWSAFYLVLDELHVSEFTNHIWVNWTHFRLHRNHASWHEFKSNPKYEFHFKTNAFHVCEPDFHFGKHALSKLVNWIHQNDPMLATWFPCLKHAKRFVIKFRDMEFISSIIFLWQWGFQVL